MPFLTKLQVEETDNGEHTWILLQDLIYKGSRETFTIPKGFKTDFGSVPWIFQWLVPGAGRGKKAFVLHDYLYQMQFDEVPRKDADGLMSRVMKELDCWKIRSWSAWAGVRIGGWFHWNLVAKEKE